MSESSQLKGSYVGELLYKSILVRGFPRISKNMSAMQETRVWFLGREDPLEKEMATHSSILAWEIPGTVAWGRKSRTQISD